MKGKLLLFAATVIAIGIVSCENEDPSVDPWVRAKTNPDELYIAAIENNTLYFSCADDYFSTTVNLSNKTREERRAWEASVGFKSLKTLIEDIDASYEDKALMQKEHADLFYMKEDSTVLPRTSIIRATVTNCDGIFYVDNILQYVHGDHFVSVSDNKIETALKVINGEEIPEGVHIYHESVENERCNKGLSLTDCGNHLSATSSNSRHRLDLYMDITTNVCTCCDMEVRRQYVATVSLKNYDRRHSNRKWREHHAKDVVSVQLTAMGPAAKGFEGNVRQYEMEKQKVDETIRFNNSNVNQSWSFKIGDYIENNALPSPKFSFVNVTGYCTESTGNVATITCDSYSNHR